MNTNKPIRRTPQLQPLSREHHDGLLFVWKIRYGLKHKTAPDLLRKFTGWYWRQHIRPHFFQEEKVLLRYIDAKNHLVERMVEEHLEIKELILAIDQDAERMDFIHLADLLERHIRFEEREFFPYLESHLAPEQLAEIAVGLESHPVCNSEPWIDEFWLAKRA